MVSVMDGKVQWSWGRAGMWTRVQRPWGDITQKIFYLDPFLFSLECGAPHIRCVCPLSSMKTLTQTHPEVRLLGESESSLNTDEPSQRGTLAVTQPGQPEPS